MHTGPCYRGYFLLKKYRKKNVHIYYENSQVPFRRRGPPRHRRSQHACVYPPMPSIPASSLLCSLLVVLHAGTTLCQSRTVDWTCLCVPGDSDMSHQRDAATTGPESPGSMDGQNGPATSKEMVRYRILPTITPDLNPERATGSLSDTSRTAFVEMVPDAILYSAHNWSLRLYVAPPHAFNLSDVQEVLSHRRPRQPLAGREVWVGIGIGVGILFLCTVLPRL